MATDLQPGEQGTPLPVVQARDASREDAPPSVPNEERLLTMYKEGCATCRNYSTLTMHTRTLAALVLAGGSAALLLRVHELASDQGHYLLFIGGLVAGLTLVLVLTSWHYQSAFEAVRNELALLERTMELRDGTNGHLWGIWRAHQRMRHRQSDLLSSYGPFLVLACGALAALGVGSYLKGDGSWGLVWAVDAAASAVFVMVGGLIYWFDRRGRRTANE